MTAALWLQLSLRARLVAVDAQLFSLPDAARGVLTLTVLPPQAYWLYLPCQKHP